MPEPRRKLAIEADISLTDDFQLHGRVGIIIIWVVDKELEQDD